jgi:isoleucyl-tRNA synthetase
VRQPLPRALVLVPGVSWSDAVRDEIASELNVKDVVVVVDLEGLLDVTVVPNFARLGKRLRKKLPRVKELLAVADGSAVRRALETDGRYTLDVDGEPVVLEVEDIEVRAAAHEELVVVQDGTVAVALDTTLDDELRLEGTARELVRAINDHRKAIGLDLADRIRVELRGAGAVLDAAHRHGEWIAGEVLAVEFRPEEGTPQPEDAPLAIDGATAGLVVEKVALS